MFSLSLKYKKPARSKNRAKESTDTQRITYIKVPPLCINSIIAIPLRKEL
jgi:hypothetical protein